MYKKGMRRAAALLAVCWLGLLFRAAAETPAEKLERLRAEQQAIEQQIEQNRTDAARAGDLVNLYTAKEQNVKAQIAVLQLKIQECEAQLAGTQAQVAAKLLEVDRSTQSFEARMKGMYEMSRQSGLAVLLGADSLSEMLTFGEYLQRKSWPPSPRGSRRSWTRWTHPMRNWKPLQMNMPRRCSRQTPGFPPRRRPSRPARPPLPPRSRRSPRRNGNTRNGPPKATTTRPNTQAARFTGRCRAIPPARPWAGAR